MKPIIAIVGPTASGKSKVGIAVAKALKGEIISADAFQLYKGMDIGTAKVTPAEAEIVPHHLIDILAPSDTFSVQEYQSRVRNKIQEIQKKDKLPIIVGGSGLYLQAALYDYRFFGDRRKKETSLIYQDRNNQELMDLIKAKNPKLAASIHPHNRRRLLRSLELADSVDDQLTNSGKTPFYDNLLVIGLRLSRPLLKERIDRRVDHMIEAGLVEEALTLYRGDIGPQAAMAIGYKELFSYFSQTVTLAEAIEQIKLRSRRYAKRQMTWFNNQMQPVWFDIDDDTEAKTALRVIAYIKENADAN